MLARIRRQPTGQATPVRGFLFQHHAEFAADVDAFLDGVS
jgi:hypothetical protein